ncbi:hypothetical protein BUALT_Bualt07G0093300 [Buddleja alternifolia]|uniref:CASP-like protein n=1 Tax=Buddleja alternifolia TaxID=168488 RepID=A0AAV6X9C4_9LAMI|nr:hypothetical protein BUALT_Bualt07G0093300 [Buddleja alternifolia]
MASTGDKTQYNKILIIAQIILRILAIAVILAATWLMLTNKQVASVFGVEMDARYSYSPAFKYFAYANLGACVSSVLGLFLAIILGVKASNPTYFFFIFIHDLIIALLLVSACAAATAIGHVGKYGDKHTGWLAICSFFPKFCNRSTLSVLMSYIGTLSYFFITILSASMSRQ